MKPASNRCGSVPGQQAQFGIHGRAVAAQHFQIFFRSRFLQTCILRNAQWDAVTQNDITKRRTGPRSTQCSSLSGTEESADREWLRLQNRFATQLAGFTPHVVAADTSAGQLYRLQVAAAGESQARALCDSLKQQSQSCVPVLPR